MGNLIYEEESFAIRGAIFEVYREIGNGFLEAVYQECMERELALRGIPFTPQKELLLTYKGVPLTQTYVPDLICCEKIIIELKAAKELAPEHRAQMMNYLRVSKMRLGLLVNFCHFPDVEIERIIL